MQAFWDKHKAWIILAVSLLSLLAIFGMSSKARADGPTKSASILPSIPGITTTGSWSGFYVGAHAGYGWSAYNGSMIYTDADKYPGFDATGKTIDTEGAIAGGQVGFNVQTGSIVWGIEADASWADMGGTAELLPYPKGYPANGAPAWVFTTNIDWLATIRGRVGVANGKTLTYATAGIAFAGVETSHNVVGPGYSAFGSRSDTLVGWTVGGGIEWMFAQHWSLKAEYLYYRFDDAGGIHTGEQSTSCKTPCAHTTDGFGGDIDLHTVRFGLNYRF